MDRNDRTTDTGMLGSDAENPGSGRDTRQTDPDPPRPAVSTRQDRGHVGRGPRAHPPRYPGNQRPTLAGAPQDTAASGQADTGMVGSETENPGPGRDTRRTDPAATAGAEDPEATAAMSDTDPDRTRLGSHEPGPARH
jgi:hypothetical protein